MKKINLLPPEIKTRRQILRRRNHYLFAGAVVVAALAVVYSLLFFATRDARSELLALEADRSQVGSQMQDLKDYQKLQESLETKGKKIQQAMGAVPDWGKIMVGVNLAVPPGVITTDISLTYTKDKGEMVLRGWANDHSVVTECMAVLGRIQEIEDVRCQFSSKGSYEGRQMIQFEIKAGVLPGQVYSLPAPKGGI